MTIYIIEHLEPKLWPWCVIEYKHISKIVGKKNVWFTNIARKDVAKLRTYGKVFTESVKTMKLQNACVLDPSAKSTLAPMEAKKFSYYVFGGILGDHPPRARTEVELTRFVKNAETRNIGKEQLSTDNAVFVVNEIAHGRKLSQLKFQDGVEIRINKIESTILPYRYPFVHGKPNVSKELVKYIRKRGTP